MAGAIQTWPFVSCFTANVEAVFSLLGLRRQTCLRKSAESACSVAHACRYNLPIQRPVIIHPPMCDRNGLMRSHSCMYDLFVGSRAFSLYGCASASYEPRRSRPNIFICMHTQRRNPIIGMRHLGIRRNVDRSP